MNIKTFTKSIRWRIVLIYCLLVFIATTIIGVFIMSQLEAYYIDSTKVNLTNIVQEGTLLSSLSAYEKLRDNKEEIQQNVDAWGKNLQQEIFVVDDKFAIVASNNANKGRTALGILDQEIILSGLGNEVSESQGVILSQNMRIPVTNMAFPIVNEGNVTGVVYLRADMSSVYSTIDESKTIFIKAMFIGLAITVTLGFFISRSITVPINDVTEKAQKMALGDFSEDVLVKSDDEIGRLAEMFNILRARLNETLREISSEKNKLETILKHMQDGLIAVDLSGQIIHANPAAAEMLKIPFVPQNINDYDILIKEMNPELMLEALKEKCTKGAGSEVFESSGSTYASRYDWFKDENGQQIGIILILQDITQRQKLENMQMDFVANVSHELKTPLTTIKSYTETLMDGAIENTDMARSFLKIVDEEADRMNRLVRDLLQLSRLDHNQESLFKKEADIITFLASVVKKVAITAEAKKQHVNHIFDREETVFVNIDKDRIEQVLLNVLSNAIKYTKEGGRIDIDVVKNAKNVEISVSDNGIGVPEDELSRVFERFFRVDKARSRALGGTGLGLAISKQIVESHDGTIVFESKEGKGSKVTITLPRVHTRGISNID